MNSNRHFLMSLLLVILFPLLLLFVPFKEKPVVTAGTDMFWHLHDEYFPEHYDHISGQVLCTEEKAVKEIESKGWEVEP